jgi:hypothetical protein
MVFRIGLISMTGSTRWRTFESRRVYRNHAVPAARMAGLPANGFSYSCLAPAMNAAITLLTSFSDAAVDWQHSAGDRRSLNRYQKRNGLGYISGLTATPQLMEGVNGRQRP